MVSMVMPFTLARTSILALYWSVFLQPLLSLRRAPLVKALAELYSRDGSARDVGVC